ncbi:hypothetical protein CV093_15225 [Oceanobacillus sp. 143]|nr:hypothetical protein CV093_15225 [Oceanobacillus sp. 143]
MNFKRADQLAQELIENILQNSSTNNRQANVYRRMFGTNTADGLSMRFHI